MPETPPVPSTEIANNRERPSDEELRSFFTEIANSYPNGISLHATPRRNLTNIRFQGLKPGTKGRLDSFVIDPTEESTQKLLAENNYNALWQKLIASIVAASNFASNNPSRGKGLPAVVVFRNPEGQLVTQRDKELFPYGELTSINVPPRNILRTFSLRRQWKEFGKPESVDTFAARTATSLVHIIGRT